MLGRQSLLPLQAAGESDQHPAKDDRVANQPQLDDAEIADIGGRCQGAPAGRRGAGQYENPATVRDRKPMSCCQQQCPRDHGPRTHKANKRGSDGERRPSEDGGRGCQVRRSFQHQQSPTRKCCAGGLEGVVSKRADGPYVPGRGHGWLKIKCTAREEFAVIGWTDPAGSREGFGSLLLGYYDLKGNLCYAGRVGTGFSRAVLRNLRRRLEQLAVDTAPTAEIAAAVPRGFHWVKPELVAEVRFTEWTPDRRLRHPVFLGLREDKQAHDVVLDPTIGTALPPQEPA